MDEKKPTNPIMNWLTTTPTPPGEGAATPVTPTITAAVRQYEIDGKDRLLLPFALILGFLFAELFFSMTQGWGLIVPVLVAAWYAVAIWYRGLEGFTTRTALLLFGAVCALALTFALFSNHWFRMWNALTLPTLLCVHLFQWSGAGRKAWSLPTMLWERFCLTLDALFCRLGAPFKAMAAKNSSGRGIYVLLGLVIAVPVLMFVFPLLISADALFKQLISDLVTFDRENVGNWMLKLAFALCIAPFLFGFLYAIRRPEKLKEKAAHAPFTVDAALPVTVLMVVDLLYIFFLAVQFAGLFGGGKYLEATGISYADYARSGFFQLVTVSVFNLALVMACLQVSKKEERGWQGVRLLSTVLVGTSVVMLISAAWKMTLYVTVYGLSFKRFLTYWGMVMLAVFFAAALLKIWKKEFSFFKVFFVAGIAGWLILNYMNVDAIVANYNVSLYQRSETAVMDLPYLAYLSYDTLGALEQLPGEVRPYHNPEDTTTLDMLIQSRRGDALRDTSDWRTWSVSACLAAMGGGK